MTISLNEETPDVSSDIKEQMFVVDKVIGLVRKGWTTKAMGRDSKNNPVGCTDPTACKWCLTGAFSAVEQKYEIDSKVITKVEEKLRSILRHYAHCPNLIRYNDYMAGSQRNVLEMLYRLETQISSGK